MYNQNNAYSQQQSYVPINRPIYSQQQFAQSYAGLKGRPVASIEEARASIIDFDGSVFYFPDLANKKIYTKQINLDGTASLFMYELKEIPVEPEITSNQYITREEFETVINQLRAAAVPPPAATESAPATKQQFNF